jgi:hypothetical protein
MTIRQTIGSMATQGRVAKLLPAGVRNRAFRMLINDLTREAKRRSNSRQIFETAAIRCDRNSGLKVVSLVSTRDIEMLLWCLKSLFYFSECTWDLLILDGGLHDADRELLEKHFPQCQVCGEPKLTASLHSELAPFPEVRAFRKHLMLAKKLIDAPLLIPDHKFLLLDSDVLFFAKPGQLIDHLRQTHVNRFAFNMEKGKINSGVAVVPPSRVYLAQIEGLLRSMPLSFKQRFWAEQEIYTVIAQECYDELNEGYAVEPVQPGAYRELVSCHFISTVRHRFFQQGVKQLRNAGFLAALHAG